MRSDVPTQAREPQDGSRFSAVTMRLLGDRWSAHLLANLVFSAIYFISARFGLELAFVSPYATAVWAPTGLSIAALLLLGYGLWPGVALGAFLINAMMSGSLIIGTGIAAGNTLEALAAAYLVTTFAHGRRAFERPQDVFRCVVLAAIASTTISASIGVITLGLAGAAAWSDAGPIWLTWWLGDAAGALLVAPLLVVWTTRSAGSWHHGRVAEAGALLVTLTLTSLAVFGGILTWSLQHSAVEFVVVPVLIWAGFRFGPRVAATAIFVLSGIAIWGTLHGFGPFAVETPNVSLLQVQAFLGVMAVMTLVLAAAVLDRERAEERLRATEERLRRAETQARQKEEQRANEAEAARDQLREFVGMVVHDLRNPLTVALGYTQLAKQQVALADASASQRTLARTESALQSMRRLVNDLLDSARIGGGRFVITRRPTDLVELVRQVIVEQQAADAEHRFVVEAPEHLTGAWDADRLRQVVVNLLSNASKYSPAGTEVRVRVQPTDGGALIKVTDQGIGIAPDRLGQLFQPFARLGQERQATGTGLGLYITKGIVEAHGGRIWVQSTVGQGSTFFVELPRHAIEEAESGTAP